MLTLVTSNLWRKLHVMNVSTIVIAKILKTRTKRRTVGTKSGRSLIKGPKTKIEMKQYLTLAIYIKP